MKYSANSQVLFVLLAACAGSNASTGKGDMADPEPRKVADAYLAAMVNPTQQAGKQYLLGGVTLDAKEAKVAEAKIVSKIEPRKEDGSLGDVKASVAALDKSGLALLGDSAAMSHTGGNNREVSLEEAKKLREQTKQLRKDLMTKFPVFSDVIRVDRTLYWHPKNPARLLLQQSGKDGSYHVDYVAFTVESKDTASSPAKQWPLRVVRFKAGDVDTGWKVLPASEWDPE